MITKVRSVALLFALRVTRIGQAEEHRGPPDRLALYLTRIDAWMEACVELVRGRA
jgi:hypothetical protein